MQSLIKRVHFAGTTTKILDAETLRNNHNSNILMQLMIDKLKRDRVRFDFENITKRDKETVAMIAAQIQ